MEYVKVCPKCGSRKITIPPAGMDLRLSNPDYCSDCKNIGIFPEIQKDKWRNLKKI